MSVTITFHTVAERLPAHGQHIIHLRETSSFGYQGFEPMDVEVEYQLTELGEDGEETGSAVCWDPKFTHKHGDVFTEKYEAGEVTYEGFTEKYEAGEVTYRVDMLFDCYHAQPTDLWIDQDEYWKCFGK